MISSYHSFSFFPFHSIPKFTGESSGWSVISQPPICAPVSAEISLSHTSVSLFSLSFSGFLLPLGWGPNAWPWLGKSCVIWPFLASPRLLLLTPLSTPPVPHLTLPTPSALGGFLSLISPLPLGLWTCHFSPPPRPQPETFFLLLFTWLILSWPSEITTYLNIEKGIKNKTQTPT